MAETLAAGSSRFSEPNPFTIAADLFDPPDHPHVDDPVGFITGTLDEFIYSKQRDVAESVQANRYTAVHSAHDTGKSFIASRLAAWWLTTRPPGEAFVVTTAPTWPQVRAILWREIRQAHITGELPGRVNQAEWWLDRTGQHYRNPRHGEQIVAYGRKPSDYDQAAFQGIHAKYVLVIIDEACGVPSSLFDAADTLVTNEHCRVLAIGNPDDPTAHFQRVCRAGSGWNVIHIDGLDTPNFTDEPIPDRLRPLLLSPTWVDERKERWGESSPLFVSKVRGLFPEEAEDTVIPLSWVRRAQERWQERTDADIYGPDRREGSPDRVGVDVARGGADKTVIALRYGFLIDRLITLDHADTMRTVGDVLRYARGAEAVVDVIGVGAGVVDRLREKGHPTVPFNASERTDVTDDSGELGFVNKRSAAWWGLRERLDPQTSRLALPPNEDLEADLTAPKWTVTSSGKIKVESKDDIRKRLGRSTDFGDAVVQVFSDLEPTRSWRPM